MIEFIAGNGYKLELFGLKSNPSDGAWPILFIHGNWHDSRCFSEKFAPYFAANGFETYALSLRGHGGSEGKEKIRWFSINQYTQDVLAAARHIEGKKGIKPVLAGHSMGGRLAMKAARSYDTPAVVLLASAPPHGISGSVIRNFLRDPMRIVRVILKRSPWVAIESRALAKGQFFSDDISTQDLDKYYKTLQEESFRAFLEQLLPVSVNRKIATLVLGAQNDQIISVGEVKKTAAAFRTEAEIFPKMAHNMQVERGWEKVADRIICWLKTQRS